MKHDLVPFYEITLIDLLYILLVKTVSLWIVKYFSLLVFFLLKSEI